ncbi:MAG TPA: selenide, water dikinase SelD, partial [Terriglobia bacterium]|nr:selenide, water dikinase SelD [Terriglobia bacterium]
DPNVLIGFETGDDAGVYQLAPDLALVQTVDFFTPIVDDPYTFGQLAAANSLSDVYAMGGRPLSALSIVGFPNSGRDVAILEKILAGGLAKMMEAGCTVIGGHSIGDDEIKFGYAVTGVVNPKHILSNAGAQPGDKLILTKRIGTGVISTAVKAGQAPAGAEQAAIESMGTLNRAASEIALRFDVHAATDITGFGLLGHARGMALASKVSLALDAGRIEFLPGALECSRNGHIPGGLKRNAEFISGCLEFPESIQQEVRNLLFDPQTSGGLLFAVAAADAPKLLGALREQFIPAQEMGEVLAKSHPLLRIR